MLVVLLYSSRARRNAGLLIFYQSYKMIVVKFTNDFLKKTGQNNQGGGD